MGKRYGMFIAGVVFSALGISFITKAGLGTSPITSLAYVLTYLFPHSLGFFTMIVNSCMFVIQALLLGKDLQPVQCLQIPAALLFSVCIDGWMGLFSGISPSGYGGQLLFLMIGCLSLGFGIALEVIPNVLVLPGEGVVRTIAGLTGWRFGRVKTGFDLGIVISALILSVAARGTVLGIREGTVIAALIVGHISHRCIDWISLLFGRWLPSYGREKETAAS